jgi:hypothetical protein
MTDRRIEAITDVPGAAWEKRGNAAWLRCPGCAGWFPVGPAMLAPAAPPCCCPRCHEEFRPAPSRPAGAA